MRTFRCICGGRLYFENTRCTACERSLGYDPASDQLLVQDGDAWKTAEDTPTGPFRLCANYAEHNICNWLIAPDDPSFLCRSCRLNDTIPDLGIQGNAAKWARIETAKRSLGNSLETSGKITALPCSGTMSKGRHRTGMSIS